MEQEINPGPYYKLLFWTTIFAIGAGMMLAMSSCSIVHRVKHKEHTTVDSTATVTKDSSYVHQVDSAGTANADSSGTVTTDSTGISHNTETEEHTTIVDSNTTTKYDTTGKPIQTDTKYTRKETVKTTRQKNDSTQMKRETTTTTNKTNTSAKKETGTGETYQKATTHKKADQRTADSNKWTFRLLPWWVWLIAAVVVILGGYYCWKRKLF